MSGVTYFKYIKTKHARDFKRIAHIGQNQQQKCCLFKNVLAHIFHLKYDISKTLIKIVGFYFTMTAQEATGGSRFKFPVVQWRYIDLSHLPPSTLFGLQSFHLPTRRSEKK